MLTESWSPESSQHPSLPPPQGTPSPERPSPDHAVRPRRCTAAACSAGLHIEQLPFTISTSPGTPGGRPHQFPGAPRPRPPEPPPRTISTPLPPRPPASPRPRPKAPPLPPPSPAEPRAPGPPPSAPAASDSAARAHRFPLLGLWSLAPVGLVCSSQRRSSPGQSRDCPDPSPPPATEC